MHQEDALILTLKKMTFQLRQDYVNMLLHETPTLYRGRQAINDAYHFAFPEGTYFAFILSAGSKVAGEEPRSLWFTLAQQHIRKHLVDFCEDFEIMSIGNRVHCIGGTTHSQQEISKKLTGMFSSLQQLPEMYTCQWTMGLGRFVTDFSMFSESIFSAQHALKYSVVHGPGQLYDGNQQSAIFEGALTLVTPAEQLSLQQSLQKLETKQLSAVVASLFQNRWEQIQQYPVYAYMLSLQIIEVGLQTLRDNMPIDRKTYEMEQQYEKEVDHQTTLEDLIAHTTSGVLSMAERYRLFLDNGRSRPIWLVISYIQEHYREKITLEDLARCADRNPQYISAVFSRECGIPISEYITSLRVEEAKKLLRSTTTPISEIALQVGYQDPKYFSRIFRKETGLYPRAYRQADTASVAQ